MKPKERYIRSPYYLVWAPSYTRLVSTTSPPPPPPPPNPFYVSVKVGRNENDIQESHFFNKILILYFKYAKFVSLHKDLTACQTSSSSCILGSFSSNYFSNIVFFFLCNSYAVQIPITFKPVKTGFYNAIGL